MPNWKKVITSGSDAALNSLLVTNAVTASIISSSYVDLTPLTEATLPTYKEGRLYYDTDLGALSFYNDEADISLQIGQEFYKKATNRTGDIILNGTPVRISGSQGDLPKIVPATSPDHSLTEFSYENHILGITTHDIGDNESGYVTEAGLVRGLNTSDFEAGDILFLQTGSPATPKDYFRNTPPPFPYDVIQVGVVARSNPGNGFIEVAPREPIHFGNITGLSGSTAETGDLWVYQSNKSWANTKVLSGSYTIDNGNLDVGGDINAENAKLTNIVNAGTDTDKFLVLDSSNNVDFRTGAQVLSDIGGQTSGNYVVDAGGATGQVGVWSSATNMSGSNNLFYDSSNNRLGIGTNTPATKLDVNGDITITNANGTNPTDAGSLYFAETPGVWGSTQYGFRINQQGTSNYLNFQSANTTTVRDILTLARDTGNVGIGTTSPTSKLQVEGSAFLNSGHLKILNNSVTNYYNSNEMDSYGTYYDWKFSGANVMRITNAGRVGIGTTSPSFPLEVNGIIKTSSSFLGTTAIILKVAALNETGIQFTNNAGSEKMRITDAGNVGIGTTSPDSLLEISSSNTTDFLKLTSGGGGATPIKLIFEKSAAEQGILEYNRNGDLEIYNTDSDGGVMIDGSASEGADLYVSNTGNVGIGTTSPTEALTLPVNKKIEIFGTADQTTNWGSLQISHQTDYALVESLGGVDANSKPLRLQSRYTEGNPGITYLDIGRVNMPRFKFYTNPTVTTGDYTQFEFNSVATAGTANFFSLKPNVTQTGTAGYGGFIIDVTETSIGTGTRKLFDVADNSNSRMTILSGGNVGIGTTSPNTKLHIEGNGTILSAIGSGNVGISLLSNGTNGLSYIYFADSADSDVGGILYNHLTNGFIFRTGGNNRHYIGTDVGIGTTTPSQKLDVNGNIKLSETAATTDTDKFAVLDSGVIKYRTGTQVLTDIGGQASLTNPVTGTGTTNYLPKFTGTSALGNSLIYDNGTNVGIGTTSPTYRLDVNGTSNKNAIRSFIGYDIYPVPNPTSLSGVVSSGGSVDTGVHGYYVTYKTAIGESYCYGPISITTTAGNNTVTLTLPISADERVTARKVYRTKAGSIYNEYLLATVNDNTTTIYVDTAADTTLTAEYRNSYYRANTTTNYITVGGIKAMTVDPRATYLGFNAGSSITSAGYNVFFGSDAGRFTTTGFSNTFIGYQSGYSNTTGGGNVVIGAQAAYSTTHAVSSVVIGSLAGRYYNSGTSNITTTSNSVFLGMRSYAATATPDNAIVIGYLAESIGDNTVVLGNDSIVTTALKGNVGIGTTSPVAKLTVSGNSIGSSLTTEINTISNGVYGVRSTGPIKGNNFYLAGSSGGLLTIGGVYMFYSNSSQEFSMGSNVTTTGYRLTIDGNTKVNGDVLIKAANLSNQENLDVDTGTETIATVAIADYDAAFFDFVIKNGTNVRSGTVFACHDGTNVEFTETSTADLGNTSPVTLSVDISGTDMRLLATTTTNNWIVKSLVRAL